MSNSVDNKVVSMTFDNKSFLRKVTETLSVLSILKDSLNFSGSKKAFSDINDAAGQVDLGPVERAVEALKDRFSILGIVGITVIQDLTRAFLDFATAIPRNAIDQIIGGGKLRAENIEQARFMLRGLNADVDAVMQSSLEAVKGTAYGLDSAAKAAAQFSASGIKTGDEMTGALRAIAGTAAMTNTSFEEMSGIFTSAAGRGKVMGQTLMQFSHRGLNAAAIMGEQWGKTEAEVREMASKSEISFEMFYQAMDQAFGEHATKANETYSGSLANMRAALSRIGAVTATAKLENMRNLFNSLTPVIDKFAEAIKPAQEAWIAMRVMSTNAMINFLDGLDFSNLTKAMPDIAASMINIFVALHNVLVPIKEAFREIFPSNAGSGIVAIAAAIKRFTENLKIGGETADKIKRTFQGFFAIIRIGIEILKGIGGLIVGIFSAFSGGESGLLNFSASVGDSLVALQKFLVEGKGLSNFFDKLKTPISTVTGFLKSFIDMLGSKFSGAASAAGGATGPLVGAFGVLSGLLSAIGKRIQKAAGAIADWFSSIKEALKNSISTGDFDGVLSVIKTGLFGGLLLLIRKFLKEGLSFNFFGGEDGPISKISAVLGELTGVLQAMQTNLKANALLKIAAAIGILAIAAIALSTVDAAALSKAMTAISVAFGQLIGTMAAMNKLGGLRPTQLSGIAAGMLLMAGAILVLSLAVKAMSKLSPEELTKGLIGVGVSLGILVLATNLLNANSKGMLRAGLTMIGMSIALIVLAKAVKAFGSMDWDVIKQGLIGVVASLGALVIAMNLLPKGGLTQGVALIAIAIALNILAKAVESFGSMDWNVMKQGLMGMAVALAAIVLAMHLLPPGMITTATGLVLVGVALKIIASAIKDLGSLSMEEIIFGLGAMAAALLILALATNAMSKALPGAVAMVVVSGALTILVRVLERLAKLSAGEIIKSLLTLAGVFVILGVAGMAMAKLVIPLMGLGVALFLLGAGFAMFGLGAMLAAKAWEIFWKATKSSVKIFGELIGEIIGLIPSFVRSIVAGLVEAIKELTNAVPVIVEFIKTLGVELLKAAREIIPEIIKTLGAILDALIPFVRTYFPQLLQLGIDLLISFLTGIRDNIGEITTLVADIITNFLDALALKVPEIIDSAYNLLMAVVEGVVSKLADIAGVLLPKGQELLGGLLEGIKTKMTDVISWFVGLPGEILSAIGDLLSFLAPKGIDTIAGFLTGIGEKFVDVVTWLAGIPGKVLDAIGDLLSTLVDKGKDLISGLVNGIDEIWQNLTDWLGTIGTLLTDAIGDVTEMLVQVGKDIIEGLKNGMESAWGSVTSWMGDRMDDLKTLVTKPWELFSPSRVAKGYGFNIMEGLALGIAGSDSASKALHKSSTNLVTLAEKTFKDVNYALAQIAMMDELAPVISPVLDLSSVEKESSRLTSLIALPLLNADVSYDAARAIAHTTDDESRTDQSQEPAGEINFTQNNYSPAALSTTDIYRNTKSQIANAKEELKI